VTDWSDEQLAAVASVDIVTVARDDAPPARVHKLRLCNIVMKQLPEKRGGEPLTMGDALAALLADITEAARTIGSLLQTTSGRVRWRAASSTYRARILEIMDLRTSAELMRYVIAHNLVPLPPP
jgi:hypothetical protein